MEPVFYPFPRLPYELRAHIWALTVEPRTVPVQCWIGDQWANIHNPTGEREDHGSLENPEGTKHHVSNLPTGLYAASPMKPSILDACRESRGVALKLYEKLILREGSDASYAWVNFDIDTIDIGEEETYANFWHCAHKVRRLKFKADMGDEWWCLGSCSDLHYFNNLVECFIVTNSNLTDWGGTAPYRPDCDLERTFIIREETGETRTLADLDQWWDEKRRCLWPEEDMSDGPDV